MQDSTKNDIQTWMDNASAICERDKKLEEAVDLVNAKIREYREKLQKIATTDEQDPILIEGETSRGFYCQLMVDPKDPARIMLDYDYPTARILGEDAPDAMWEDLGRFYGLQSISSVDL